MKAFLPLTFVIVVGISFAIAVANEKMPGVPNLSKTEWTVETIHFKDSTKAIIPDEKLTLSFDENQQLILEDSGQNFSANYNANTDGSLSIIGLNNMKLNAKTPKSAQLVMSILPKVSKYNLENNILSFVGGQTAITLSQVETQQ